MVQIIGAGMGRTSTMSLKHALEMLGFAPCHHMIEMKNVPNTAEGWHRAALGEEVDYAALLEGYQASCDWPSSAFWKPLSETFPEAKIILTERPAEKWWSSISQTIFVSLTSPRDMTVAPERRAQRDMAEEVIVRHTFGGNVTDKDHVLAVYRAHNAAVKAAFGPERLLVFDGAEGWEPLCAFLGVRVPDADYPNTNSTAEFQARFHERQNQAAQQK